MSYRKTCAVLGAYVWLVVWPSTAFTETTVESGLLPDSLARWYKPENKRQVWLHTMFAMRRELQAVEEYGKQGDAPRLKKWAERLTAHYRRIPEMVPEWADELEPSLAARLEQAAGDGNTSAAAAAARRLARTCRSCHREFRALAAARFRAPDFGGISVPDGNGSELSYADAMEALSRSVNRIKIATEDGRWGAATTALDGLKGQLEKLGTSCENCRRDDPPRERILGAAAQETLEHLDRDLERRQTKDAGRHLGEAAVNICARCHGVHRTLADLRSHLFK